MDVGDIVIRRIQVSILEMPPPPSTYYKSREPNLGEGIIISKQMAGSNPVHPCITVWYPSAGKTYDIAESLMELVNESR